LGNSFDGAYQTLKARGLSYNYIIDADGTTYEIVPWYHSAWHAGIKSNPNKRVVDFYGNKNPNRHSVGVAFVRKGQPLTESQIDGAVKLIKWLGKQTKVVYDESNIFYHQEITDYKPKEVEQYRSAVLEALFGEKEDVQEKMDRILETYRKNPNPAVRPLLVKLLIVFSQYLALLKKRL
jgi:N-acetyl-anhydromuramyl-L-alanine amidase AmpD